MTEDKRTTYIDIYGKQYPMCLTVSANERINQTFGGLSKMGEIMEEDGENAVGTMVDLIHILLCGGRDRVKALAWLDGETVDTPEVPESAILKDMISLRELGEFKYKAYEAMGVSTERMVEVEQETGKNAETT